MRGDDRADPGNEFVHWSGRDRFDLQDVAQVRDAQELAHGQIDTQLCIRSRQQFGHLRIQLALNELTHQGGRLVVGRGAPQDPQ